jgi:hypothetical protein
VNPYEGYSDPDTGISTPQIHLLMDVSAPGPQYYRSIGDDRLRANARSGGAVMTENTPTRQCDLVTAEQAGVEPPPETTKPIRETIFVGPPISMHPDGGP